MNYRERFEATVKHMEVDRVPFDLAGTSLTGMEHPDAIEKIRLFLGFTEKYDGEYQKFDERILKYLDIDFRRVGDILSPESHLACQISENEFIDCWGITRVFTGLYWDIKKPPLKGASIADLDKYPWPQAEKIDMNQIDMYREQAKKLYKETDYVVCAEHPVFGVLELGCWMCGFDDFLLRMTLEPEFVIRFFDKFLDYQKKVIEIYYGAIGEYIHVTTSGDDFGTQTGPFMSPGMFEKLVKPYYKERIDYTKKFMKGYYFHHTCGSVYSLIPHLIDAGVDILNPIQPGARDMEPEKLKNAYGNRITFWGGIDTQHILPHGTTTEVKNEVFKVLKAISGNGGYILSPAHNIQPDVPAENIIALFNAGREYFDKKT
ncbi:MAG: uroporphyrinogen decarboxylase family protein [Clostridiales bacterium]|nr:uroporphyrinogen decarboxylase family protein [Clostridiales bacterium]